MKANNNSTILQELLDRLAAGDGAARADLIQAAENRLLRLTRKMLRSFPRVHRWEMTDDVFQTAVLRLHNALAEVSPKTVGELMSFSAFLIRRELIDLSRHYGGPQGLGGKYRSASNVEEIQSFRAADGVSNESEELVQWSEFHQAVNLLPAELRTVFDLLWYQELSQAEAATIMQTSERTVQRRWLDARMALHRQLGSRGIGRGAG